MHTQTVLVAAAMWMLAPPGALLAVPATMRTQNARRLARAAAAPLIEEKNCRVIVPANGYVQSRVARCECMRWRW